jgi:pimeloyl-ACP methyl ester carboxylesterase
MPYAVNDGLKIHYRAVGNGPPLVLLHGFTDSSESCYEFGYVSALHSKHRLILIDMRGHGESDRPHDPEAYTSEKLASDVISVLDDLQIPKAAYWGYSQGGWIGFAIASFSPDRISAFIIGGAAASGVSAFQSMPGAEDILLAALRKGPDALIGIYGDASSPALAERLRASDMAALIACRQQRLASSGHPDVTRSISVPCLMYAGTTDAIHDTARETASQIADCQFVSLPRLNHAQAWVRSELILPQAQRFLDRMG